ncbi:aldo/keto reductase [Campylobacter sp. LR264d]|nr:aldo/keto reductase [Campylobacter sp. LR185c]KAA6224849.1 aldo/keto reductase [Campylobacter sp. LR286c]KAA6227996.1 aldo/keto reductase [Campylobacter sp. LR196d]KAA6234414.1 aldo/keto reductase [Campylobacter sp. LR264d]KAA8603529.1 hypothetical protein CGP82_06785 [Campylobacter sp. LR185c]
MRLISTKFKGAIMQRREFLKQGASLGAIALMPNFLSSDILNFKGAKVPEVILNNKISMPQFGFGTWDIRGEEGVNAMLEAYRAGYRLIDSASYYKNEEQVGIAFRKSGLKREEVFITTKIASESDTKQAFENSLKRLQMDYVDLYLLHWSTSDDINRYKVLERLYKDGKIRSIGVSNFNISELNNLMSNTSIIPAVNQIKINPFERNNKTIEFCKDKNIAIEAYTPLGNIKRAMKNEILTTIAKNHNKTVAQIMLKWSVQSGFIAIPKSSNASRIKENIDIFDFTLSADEMAKIGSLS